MKKITYLLVASILLMPLWIEAQDKRSLAAAEISFKSAQKEYAKKQYKEASQHFDIVVNLIPSSADKSKHIEMRLESLIALIDIHFYKAPNFTNACGYLQDYANTIDACQKSGVLKSAKLLKYLKQLQEYNAKEANQCDSYQRIGSDMDAFRNTFNEVFDE